MDKERIKQHNREGTKEGEDMGRLRRGISNWAVALALMSILGGCAFLSTRYVQSQLNSNWGELRVSHLMAHSENKITDSQLTEFLKADVAFSKVYRDSACLTVRNNLISGCEPNLSERDNDFLKAMIEQWTLKLGGK